MATTNEEIARDLLIAAISGIATGASDGQAAKIAAAYKTILEGVDAASDENWLRMRKRANER